MVDFTALAALLVSLVAFVVAFTQVVQQYAATGYDYRRCSTRTMGGWAERTHRKFIWREIRFEVTFSTPRITIDVDLHSQNEVEQSQSVEVLRSQNVAQNEEEHVLSVETKHLPTSESSAQYCLKEVSSDGRESGVPEWYRIEQKPKPWFLSAEATLPEAKCPWLNFLEDMASTNLKITLTETRSSYDFVPEGIQRPVAVVDGILFLTIMSLFGIQWNNKGIDGKFTGTAESGFCEIASTNVFNFGDVYLYRRTPRLGRPGEQWIPELKRTRFSIVSEKARQAMFSCFDLGFTTIRTHDSSELGDSLRRLHIPEGKIRNFVGCFDAMEEWCPGVRDAIGCWAAPSMPKMVYVTRTNVKDGYERKFKSVFSARATGPFMGDPVFAAMLLGGEHHNITLSQYYKERFDSVDSVKTLTVWAKAYLASLPPVTKNLLYSCLMWIASQQGLENVMLSSVPIPYSQSVECLKGILVLDQHLDTDLLSHFLSDHEKTRQIKLKFCSEQIQCQYEVIPDMDKANRDHGGGKHRPWHLEADRVGSGYYCELASNIADSLELGGTLAQDIVVNRLMRASLWSAHNGNAPIRQSQRSLVCSLSSRWLEQNFTIYLS